MKQIAAVEAAQAIIKHTDLKIRGISERLQNAHTVAQVQQIALSNVQKEQRAQAAEVVKNVVKLAKNQRTSKELSKLVSKALDDKRLDLPEVLKKKIKKEIAGLKSAQSIERVAVALLTDRGIYAMRLKVCLEHWAHFLRPENEAAWKSVALVIPRLIYSAFANAAKAGWTAVKGVAVVSVGTLAGLRTVAGGLGIQPNLVMLRLHLLRQFKTAALPWARMSLWARGWTAAKYKVAEKIGLAFTPIVVFMDGFRKGGEWTEATFKQFELFAHQLSEAIPKAGGYIGMRLIYRFI